MPAGGSKTYVVSPGFEDRGPVRMNADPWIERRTVSKPIERDEVCAQLRNQCRRCPRPTSQPHEVAQGGSDDMDILDGPEGFHVVEVAIAPQSLAV